MNDRAKNTPPQSAWRIVVPFAGATAYTAYSAYFMTGLAGWISYLQQMLFGGYLLKLSVVLTFAIVGIGLAAAVEGADRLRARWRAPAQATPAIPPPAPAPLPGRQQQSWLLVWCLLVVLTWGIGLGVWFWQAQEERADAQARYVPLVLGAMPPATPLKYVALTGRLRYEQSLEHRVGSAGGAKHVDQVFVPVTAPDASTGQPVLFVALFGPTLRPTGETVSGRRAVTTLLGHVEGPLAVPAARAFERAGVVVDDSTRVVRVVPSVNGAPVVSRRAEKELGTMVKVCAGASGLFSLTVLALWGLGRRAARRG